MIVFNKLVEWVNDRKHLVIIILLVLLVIRGCNFNITYLNNGSSKTCDIPELRLLEPPAPPIEEIAKTKEDYKVKSLVLTGYIEDLAEHIKDTDKKIKDYQDLLKEKCQK